MGRSEVGEGSVEGMGKNGETEGCESEVVGEG